jgi:hypothetical protein
VEYVTMTGQWSRDAGTPPFVDLVPIEKAKGARKELYDEMERVRGPGRVSNLFKAYAAFPALAKANFHRLWCCSRKEISASSSRKRS